MFATFTAEFTRGALLIVNSIEMMAVIYGVLYLLNYLNKSETAAAAQLAATQAQTVVLQQLLAQEQAAAAFLQNSQPKD